MSLTMLCQRCGGPHDRHCQIECVPGHGRQGETGPSRLAHYCDRCHEDYGFDLWSSEEEWNSLNPVVRFADLE